MRRGGFFLVLTMTLLTALGTLSCGNRMSSADLQSKIDSIRAIENIEHLKLQGINLEELNPIAAFFDSLSMQTLPVRYSEEFVSDLPRFTTLPPEIVALLQVQGAVVKAISLPESLGARLLLVAVDGQGSGDYALWLYSLDVECLPVDRLLLYAPATYADLIASRIADFAITSDYEIKLREISGNQGKQTVTSYVLGDDRTFMRQN